MAASRALGLRLQIVLALAGLMLLAFVPLFFAVASATGASLDRVRAESARELTRGVALHVREVPPEPSETRRARLAAAIAEHESGTVRAAAVIGEGAPIAIGPDADRIDLAAIGPNPTSSIGRVRREDRQLFEVVEPLGDGRSVVALVADGAAAERAAPLVRLVALYMGIFAVALLTFAYFSLTRLIVRPVESLARATERVADGARTLSVPSAGARELADLGDSVKTMASRLLAEEAKLRTKVDELTETTRRLTEARAQVVRGERMASVGRLAAGLAHEVGNPLAAILGMQELLLGGDLDDETQRDFVQRMKKETERIHGVVRDLLDFARPEEPPSMSAIGLPGTVVREVVDDVVGLARPQKEFKSIELDVDIPGDLPRVALASPRLTQVLLNLVLNAGAVARSRIAVRAELAPERRGEPRRVRICVEDDGPGVPAAMHEQIFEPFVTTKEVGEGTGLGLSVCRGIVEAANGSIQVDPDHSGGARIVIELPIAAG